MRYVKIQVTQNGELTQLKNHLLLWKWLLQLWLFLFGYLCFVLCINCSKSRRKNISATKRQKKGLIKTFRLISYQNQVFCRYVQNHFVGKTNPNTENIRKNGSLAEDSNNHIHFVRQRKRRKKQPKPTASILEVNDFLTIVDWLTFFILKKAF